MQQCGRSDGLVLPGIARRACVPSVTVWREARQNRSGHFHSLNHWATDFVSSTDQSEPMSVISLWSDSVCKCLCLSVSSGAQLYITETIHEWIKWWSLPIFCFLRVKPNASLFANNVWPESGPISSCFSRHLFVPNFHFTSVSKYHFV